MNEPVTIDPEFQSLIPSLSSEEFHQLTENCKRDGILDSLKVWNGILIDGHNRYRIAEELDLNYQIEEMEFPNREAAIRWIILNQFGRRNLSAYDRSVLALKLKPVIAEKATEKQSEAGGAVRQKSDKAVVDTKKELAKVAGVSHDTIHKVETIEKNAPESVKEAVRSGDVSINQAYRNIMQEQIPHPKTTKQKEYAEVQEAKERHADYQQKKSDGIVSIQDAKQDKEDRKRIAEDLYNDLLSITTKSHWISVLNTASDFDALADVIPDDRKGSMRERIEKMIVVLNKVMEVLDESKIRK